MASTINASTSAGLVSTADTSGVLQLQAANTTVLNAELGKALALQGATSTTGCGIAFPATQVTSTDANTLDDYEEGTWTPALEANGQVGSYTYTLQVGTYTKIGNTVFGTIEIAWSALPSVGAATRITGLPFVWNVGFDGCGGSMNFTSGVPVTNGNNLVVGETGGGSRTAFDLYSGGSTVINTTTGNNLSASGVIRANFMYIV